MPNLPRDLQPAADLAAIGAAKPYPHDSPAYRAARQALLEEEIALRRQILRVAEQRRALPPGGAPGQDYRFQDENGRTVGLADLFGAHDTLFTYTWMYGPERERPCPMCTATLGSIDTPARDLSQRIAVAVIGRSPVARQMAFARERGWRNLRFFQCSDDFARDYRALAPDGSEWPAIDVWVRRGGAVHHFWSPEGAGTQDPGFDPHLAPEIAPLWTILDLTPGGRGTDWYPKLDYGSGEECS